MKKLIEKYLKDDKKKNETLEEIRLRAGRPIILQFNDTEKIFRNNKVTYGEILATVQRVCENSIYS